MDWDSNLRKLFTALGNTRVDTIKLRDGMLSVEGSQPIEESLEIH